MVDLFSMFCSGFKPMSVMGEMLQLKLDLVPNTNKYFSENDLINNMLT